MTNIYRATTVERAIADSPMGCAVGASARGLVIFARRAAEGLRIVKSVTDPTIIRALTPREEAAQCWLPVNRSKS
jgi:hypothetical protein